MTTFSLLRRSFYRPFLIASYSPKEEASMHTIINIAVVSVYLWLQGLSFNLPAAVLIIGLASLSTIGANAVKTDLDSLQYFGESAVRAGWIAFFIGLVMTSGLLQNEANLIEFLPRAISIIFLGPLYGYVLNFLTKILSPR